MADLSQQLVHVRERVVHGEGLHGIVAPIAASLATQYCARCEEHGSAHAEKYGAPRVRTGARPFTVCKSDVAVQRARRVRVRKHRSHHVHARNHLLDPLRLA